MTDLAAAIASHEVEGYRLDMITPADDPTTALMSRNGETVELTGTSQVGRAGMEYRDLIPDRLGGRFIASHIRITDGGPVPDSVHFHDIGFQVIVCRAGWVRVVYEDQGPPFVLTPGDVVLQPPGIRHRVLEASPGLEVVEVAGPARHPTRFDHELVLPTPGPAQPDRAYGAGQRFVHHVAASDWARLADGWDEQRTGVAAASHGAGDVRLLRATGTAPLTWTTTEALTLLYLTGGATAELAEDDSLALPSGSEVTLTPSRPATVLEVTVAQTLGL